MGFLHPAIYSHRNADDDDCDTNDENDIATTTITPKQPKKGMKIVQNFLKSLIMFYQGSVIKAIHDPVSPIKRVLYQSCNRMFLI